MPPSVTHAIASMAMADVDAAHAGVSSPLKETFCLGLR